MTKRELLRQGFSLAEILVALTILSIAMAFVGQNVYKSLQEGKVSAAKIQMQNFSNALAEFRRHCNFYPTTDQGLEALVSKPSGRECKRYSPGGYLDKEVPLDPWDTEYLYTSDGNNFNIISLGGDQQEGGEAFDADISLNEKRAGTDAAQSQTEGTSEAQ